MARQTRDLKGHAVVFTLFVVAAVGFSLWLLSYGGQLPWQQSGYAVKAVLPTAGSLAPGARVTMAGAEVGRVSSISPRGVGAIVNLQIRDDRVTPIPVDSVIRLQMHTVVGENYVSITPGRSAQMLRSGGLFPISQAGQYVDVDQILSVLQGEARQRLRGLIQGLGGAVQGRGERLNALLGGSASALTYLSNAVQVAAKDTPNVSRLVQQLGNLSAAVGERDTAIQQIASEGLAALNAIGTRDASVRAILRALPGVLAQVRTTTNTLNTVTDVAAPVVTNLAGAVSDVRPAVGQLEPSVNAGRTIVQHLGAAAPGLEQTLSDATKLSKPTPLALPQLKQTLCQANPLIRFLKPYTDDLIAFIVGFGSASNAYDRFSHTIRLDAIINENSLVGLPPALSQAAYSLLHAGLLTKMSGLSFDPYPKPGLVGSATAAGKNVLGPAQVSQTGYVFPHVLAGC
jgi:phospholipid/cholesterol/gamma-HCH transport system substrate-binding protein